METSTKAPESFEAFSARFEAEAKAAAEWAKANGYALADLHICTRLSKESTAFSANLLRNGVKVGTAENDGWGGPDMVMTTDTLTTEEYKRLEMWVGKAVEDAASAEEEKKAKKSLIGKVLRAAKKQGFAFVALEITETANGLSASYIMGRTREGLVANLAKKGKTNYEVLATI